MTVAELGERMDARELMEWMVLDGIRSDERKRAEQQAKQGMRQR